MRDPLGIPGLPGPLAAELSRLRALTAAHRPIRAKDVHPIRGINQAVAVWVTDKVGTMGCAYLFCGIALVSLPAAIMTGNVIVIVSWIAQTFFQLVLLSVIMVGQKVQQAHADALAQQTFEASQRSAAELEAIHAQTQDLQAKLAILTGLKVLPSGD